MYVICAVTLKGVCCLLWYRSCSASLWSGDSNVWPGAMIKWTGEIRGRCWCILHVHMRYKACKENDNLCFVNLFFFFLMFCFLNVCKCIYSGRRRRRRRRKKGRGARGNWLQRLLFRIVNVLHRPRCPITYIFHVWNHACLFLQKGGGGLAGTKGATPTAAEHCAAHMKK